eukprot:927423-Amphidinium_carterae.1
MVSTASSAKKEVSTRQPANHRHTGKNPDRRVPSIAVCAQLIPAKRISATAHLTLKAKQTGSCPLNGTE